MIIVHDHRLAISRSTITALTRMSARMNSEMTEMLPIAEGAASPPVCVTSTFVVGAASGALSAASLVGAAEGALCAIAVPVRLKQIANTDSRANDARTNFMNQ